jgi:hypothetical protein
MKIKVTESQLTTYFSEVISEMDTCPCEESVVLSEALTVGDKSDIKSMVKKEIKDFLDINRSSDLDKKVEDIIKKKFKNDKDIEKYIVDVTRNVLIQLYKTMYTRKGFWTADLKNSPN